MYGQARQSAPQICQAHSGVFVVARAAVPCTSLCGRGCTAARESGARGGRRPAGPPQSSGVACSPCYPERHANTCTQARMRFSRLPHACSACTHSQVAGWVLGLYAVTTCVDV